MKYKIILLGLLVLIAACSKKQDAATDWNKLNASVAVTGDTVVSESKVYLSFANSVSGGDLVTEYVGGNSDVIQILLNIDQGQSRYIVLNIKNYNASQNTFSGFDASFSVHRVNGGAIHSYSISQVSNTGTCFVTIVRGGTSTLRCDGVLDDPNYGVGRADIHASFVLP